ncbi:hypothetical protein BGZ72_008065 [Mortierella alpina]|nr:hypothetical protein BGZ72_008065 [Mortierella alpina]
MTQEPEMRRRAVTPSDDEAGLSIDKTSQAQEDAGIKEEDASNKEEALRNESEKERAEEEARRAEEDARRAKEEEARLKKEQADRDAQAEAERQRVAAENAQKAKAEADRQAAEAARLAKEAADRKAQEDMIRKAQEEADKKTKDQEEADKKKKETEENQKDGDKNSSDEKDGSDADNSRVAEGEGRSQAEATTSDKSKIVVAISIASGGVIVAAFVVGLIFTRARQARKRNSARDAYLTRKVDLDPIYGPAPPFSRMSRNDDRNNGGPIASAMMGPRPSHDNRHSLPCMQDMHHHRHYDEVHDRRDSAWATGMPSLVAAPNPAHLSRISHEIGQKQQHPNQHRHSRQSLVPGSLSKEVFGQQQQLQQQPQQQQQLHLPHRQQLYGRHSMEPQSDTTMPSRSRRW